MELIKKLLTEQNYEEAYKKLQEIDGEKTGEEYYICMAAVLEGLDRVDEALDTARAGYEHFCNNYELAFMMANYLFYKGDREQGYFYYLLSQSLCDTQDKEFITQNIQAIDTSDLDCEKSKEFLEKILRERMAWREYDKTFKFVTDTIYSQNEFLFEKVIDKWLRYYCLILEITSCEKNRGLTEFTADRFADWKYFEKVMADFKFAYRRVWFGFPCKDQQYLVQLYREYKVSPEFVVIMSRCSMADEYVASALEKAAVLMYENNEMLAADILIRYSKWFESVSSKNLRVADEQAEYSNNAEVIRVDAGAKHFREKAEQSEYKQSDNSITDVVEAQRERNVNEVAYIMCANNQAYVDEVVKYLHRQQLPAGLSMKIYVVWNAKSMTAGYNAAMNISDAAYKIYIHQDTFISDIFYTSKILERLQTTKYHMLGLAGAEEMPGTGKWWDCNPMQKRMCLYQDFTIHTLNSVTDSAEVDVKDVQALDGVLIATKTDLQWREDLFDNFHFYDVSQSMEFLRHALPVGYYNNKTAGVLHEVSVSKDKKTENAYEEARKVFVKEYLQN